MRLVAQVGEALDAAHARRLIHRDVKPANVLVTASDFAYLTDFGIASQEGDTRLTQTGMTVGSFSYMAPERFEGTGTADERADIYALGCVLYEILTGKQPFPGATVASQAGAHIAAPRPRATDARPDLPTGIDGVIAQAMAIDPDRRFTSCAMLSAAALAASDPQVQRSPETTAAARLPAEPTAHNPHDQTQPASQSMAAVPSSVAPGPRAQASAGRRSGGAMLATGALVLVAALGGAAYLYTQKDAGDDTTVADTSRGADRLTDRGPSTPAAAGAESTQKEAPRAAPTAPGSTPPGPEESTGVEGPPAETSTAQSPTSVAVALPGAAQSCPARAGSQTGELRAYVAYNDADDPCAWALNVTQAVHANGDQASPTMRVFSPQRGKVATVTCDTGEPIRCKSDGRATAWVLLPGQTAGSS